ncbi:MAG: glutathione S-transferase family protein [Salaquimonas sp.]|jgi:glutathione S-transferase|nr:glutathione S-transferase family protein [Salaquimonas sp.]
MRAGAGSLRLYYHPLASFCWKVLIALYENDTAFEPVVIDLFDPNSAARLRAVWSMMKFPVLRDDGRGHTVAESTIVIDYLDTHERGPVRFIPADVDLAWQARMWDRFFDAYIHEQMQRIVGDALRPADAKDPTGVGQARDQLRQSYDFLETRMAGRKWVVGDGFTLADCAAAPALFYANIVEPFAGSHRALTDYLARLMRRPSFARVLEEAEPSFVMFPLEPKPSRVVPEFTG